MTGSLQKKNGKYYAVINTYENGKRKQKWIDTGFAIKGNKMRAEKALRETKYHAMKLSPALSNQIPCFVIMQDIGLNREKERLILYHTRVTKSFLTATYVHISRKD